jgi:hypothetical protein
MQPTKKTFVVSYVLIAFCLSTFLPLKASASISKAEQYVSIKPKEGADIFWYQECGESLYGSICSTPTTISLPISLDMSATEEFHHVYWIGAYLNSSSNIYFRFNATTLVNFELLFDERASANVHDLISEAYYNAQVITQTHTDFLISEFPTKNPGLCIFKFWPVSGKTGNATATFDAQLDSSELMAVSVDPQNSSVSVGQPFSVNISIVNVPSPGIFSYQLSLHYNETVLRCLNASIPAGQFLTPLNQSNIFIVDPGTINQTGGYVTFAESLLDDEPLKTGSGVLATLQFSGLAAGTSQLQLNIMLVSSQDYDFVYQVRSGSVTVSGVVPEFQPIGVLLVLLLLGSITFMTRRRLLENKRAR